MSINIINVIINSFHIATFESSILKKILTLDKIHFKLWIKDIMLSTILLDG